MGTGEKKCLSYPRESLKMGTGKKKMLSYPKESLGMGTGEKKRLSYPKESLRMGTGEKKFLSYPRESLKMGTGEKVSFIPKGKFKNGYRKKKWIEIPKRKGKWTGNLLLENEIGKI